MAKRSIETLKNKTAQEQGVDLSKGANLTTGEVGKVGGNMVRKMVEFAEQRMGDPGKGGY